MKLKPRNDIIIQKILKYCEDIKESIKYFGDDFDEFSSNSHYRNDVLMYITQIGELSNCLTRDFKDSYNEIPWKAIRGMRNVAVHEYGDVSIQSTWDTIHGDIDDLISFCDRAIEDMKKDKKSKG